MTLNWTDFAIMQALDLIKLSLIPFVVWLFRNQIKKWFKGNGEKKKCKNFKPEGLGF